MILDTTEGIGNVFYTLEYIISGGASDCHA